MYSFSLMSVLLSSAVMGAAVPTTKPAPLVGTWPGQHAICRPISLRSIRLGGFLGGHVDANNRASIPAGLDTIIPKAIEARARGEEPPAGCNRLATDSDFFKWLEGACYAIAYEPTIEGLAGTIDRYVEMLVRLQSSDGYIGTRLSPVGPFDEKVRHDLYVAGHFIEAAVAHYEATGSRRLLDAAERLADFYRGAYERHHPYFKLIGQEHPCIEAALVRLARATGQQRFLGFASALTRMAEWGPKLSGVRAGASRRHAVRLCYLLSGSAELYMQTDEEDFFRYLPSLWDELVSTRMYVTGGIGYNEVVPEQPYDLPQTIATRPGRNIAETCASVSLMMFTWRMHALTGESSKFDVIETILYNHYLGAISRDHLGVFYYNPLKCVGDLADRTDHGGNPVRRTRLPQVHSTACCMPNAWRFFAQLPEYVLSTRDDGLCVNLYSDATARHVLPDGTTLSLDMQTRYPHEGEIRLKVSVDRPAHFALYLRIPAWCDSASVKIGQQSMAQATAGTYHRIEREWQSGDEILLSLPMKPAAIFGAPQVVANRGQIVFRRGPLIYCLEKQDAAGLDLEQVVIPRGRDGAAPSVTEEFNAELGVYVLKGHPRERRDETSVRSVQLVPFYVRANRAEDTRWITWIGCE